MCMLHTGRAHLLFILALSRSFRDFFVSVIIDPSWKHGWNLAIHLLMFVSSFPSLHVTYVVKSYYSFFSGASLGCAPARHDCLRRNFKK